MRCEPRNLFGFSKRVVDVQARIGYIKEALHNVAEMHRASGDFEAAAEAYDAGIAMMDPRG